MRIAFKIATIYWYGKQEQPVGEKGECRLAWEIFINYIKKPKINIYILLDGLVCSIVGYFYESRRILASP